MKRYLILIVCLIFWGGMKGQTNVYHPFPDSNAWWGQTNWWIIMIDLEDGTDYNDTNKLFMAGDTLIDSNHYQILLQSGFLQTTDMHFGNTSSSFYFNNYKGAIRQDTLLKRVYIVPPDS